MYVLITCTCKYENEPIKIGRENGETSFPLYKSMDIFLTLKCSCVVHGQIFPNFELIKAFMYVIVTCNYVKGSIKIRRKKTRWRHFPYYNHREGVCCHGNKSLMWSGQNATASKWCVMYTLIAICLLDSHVWKCNGTHGWSHGRAPARDPSYSGKLKYY